MITSEPNSPTAFANASATPDRIPGRMFGKTTRRNVVELGGAERAGRLLHLRVELLQHGLHRADDERQRDEQQREHDRRPRVGDVDADRRARPVEGERASGPRRSSAGRTGRSITAFTSALPRKSSRTSTQAVIVPRTAFGSETTSDAPRVSFSAATACGLETASQKPVCAVLRRRPDEGGERQHDEHREERRDEAEGQGRSGPVPLRCATGARRLWRC